MRILGIIFTAALFPLFAQESPDYTGERSSFKHSLGLHAGASTGQGFSYRYFPEKWGIQITGIPIFNGNQGYYTSSAVSILYKIKEHKKVDLFAYLGNHLIFERYQSYYWPGPWPGEEPGFITDRTYNIGLGAGINIHLWTVLDLSLQAGYGLNSWNNAPISTIFSGEIGVYYKF
jgi:hypothetical protein